MTMQLTATASDLSVKIDGNDISDVLSDALAEIEVENDLNLPDVATLRFHLNATDGDVTKLPDKVMKDYLKQGATVEISHKVQNNVKCIFNGEVVSVGLDYSVHEPGAPMFATVQAFDRAHRLHRGRKTRSFANVKASEVASKIAQEHSLTAEVTATNGVFERLFQSRQTDWEFLKQLASRVGYDLFVDGKKLYFQPRKDAQTQVTVKWGADLLQFRAHANTVFQTPEVVVRGWDPEKQEALVGKATSGKGAPSIGDSASGTAQAKQAFGDAKLEITDRWVGTQDEAQKMAESAMDEIAMDHLYAEGTAFGRGDLVPGVGLKVERVGERFSGTYTVTATTHRYTGWGGYTTSFVVGGRKENTLLGPLAQGGVGALAGTMQGVVIGLVTNIEDPKDQSRVKVKFPSLAEQEESDWVRRAVPDAGGSRGMQWTPEVNDEVLVAFEHGDLNRPYVIGMLWNGKAAPPLKASEASSGGKVTQRIIQSKAGHVIILDDSEGNEKIVIRDKTKDNEVILDSKEKSISITTGKDLTIKANGKVTLDNGTGDVSITCNNFSVDAKQDCSLKGLQVGLEAQTQATVKGNAQVSVESTGTTEIKGAMVMIN